jgi:plastocyanin
MFRGLLVLAAAAAATAIWAGAGSSESAVGRQLDGTFGPGTFQITLTKDGQQVTSLRPGIYWLTVHDNSTRHNFHLLGPNIDEVLTTVPGNTASNGGGDVTVKVLLLPGTYRLQCDPHASIGMVAAFDVGGVGETGGDD